jgi:hypothetical protein
MKKLLIVAMALLAVSSTQRAAPQFMIGMLRGDGTLVPFAQYGNGGWWNPWPKPRPVAESIYAESTEVMDNSLADLADPWFTECGKLPTPWFFSSSAGTFTVLKASKVVQVRAHSGTNWGLVTDFPQRASNDPLHDVIGVAATVREEIEPFVKIEPASTQGKEIGSFIKEIFNNEDGRKVEASVTVLYRSSSAVNGEHLYYFEAEKHYPKQGTECSDVSLFQGWISEDERHGLGLMASNLVLTDCDRKGPSTMIPVGSMKLQEQIFLFVREHGWESESYIILELNQSGLRRVLQTAGA